MKKDKKLSGFRLTEEAKGKLIHLASLDERSQSYIVEQLIHGEYNRVTLKGQYK